MSVYVPLTEPPRAVWRDLWLEGSLSCPVPRSTRPSCVSARCAWFWSPGLITPVSKAIRSIAAKLGITSPESLLRRRASQEHQPGAEGQHSDGLWRHHVSPSHRPLQGAGAVSLMVIVSLASSPVHRSGRQLAFARHRGGEAEGGPGDDESPERPHGFDAPR